MDFSSINFNFSSRNYSNCGSDIHKRSTCPSLPCSLCGEIGHTSTTCSTNMEGRKFSNRIRLRRENLSQQQIEDQRGRHRRENLSEQQIEDQRGRHRAENLNEYQIENQRGRRRLENMSEIQIENQRGRHRSENMNEYQI